MKARAFCNSAECNVAKWKAENPKKTAYAKHRTYKTIEKFVPKTVLLCPDCKNVLFWKPGK